MPQSGHPGRERGCSTGIPHAHVCSITVSSTTSKSKRPQPVISNGALGSIVVLPSSSPAQSRQ